MDWQYDRSLERNSELCVLVHTYQSWKTSRPQILLMPSTVNCIHVLYKYVITYATRRGLNIEKSTVPVQRKYKRVTVLYLYTLSLTPKNAKSDIFQKITVKRKSQFSF